MDRNAYEKRLLRVVEYIHANLDGDLSLDALADIAAMSRFHWHRVFHAMTGETAAQATRRIRLTEASVRLIRDNDPVSTVAKRCGYPNQASFSRAFRDAYGMSPAAYRKRGIPAPPVRINARGQFEMYHVEIRTEPERRVAAIAHKGDYQKINEAFTKAAATLGARGLKEKSGKMIGIFLDDPETVAAEDLRSFAGHEITEDAPITDPLTEHRLVGGRYAVLKHVGPYTGLPKAYTYLFGDWLPNSGEEPGDAPPFEIYENTPLDTRPEELITLIAVPIK